MSLKKDSDSNRGPNAQGFNQGQDGAVNMRMVSGQENQEDPSGADSSNSINNVAAGATEIPNVSAPSDEVEENVESSDQ